MASLVSKLEADTEAAMETLMAKKQALAEVSEKQKALEQQLQETRVELVAARKMKTAPNARLRLVTKV